MSSKSNTTFEGRKEETTTPLDSGATTTEKVEEAQEGKTETPVEEPGVDTASTATASAPTADEGHE